MPADHIKEAQVLADVPGTIRRLLNERNRSLEKTAQAQAELDLQEAALQLADRMDAHGMLPESMGLSEKVAHVKNNGWDLEEMQRRLAVLDMTDPEASGMKVASAQTTVAPSGGSEDTDADGFYAEVLN